MSFAPRFDTRLTHIPPKLIALIGQIDQLKGQWISNTRLSPQILSRLKKSVLVTSTGASTRIEGSKLSDKEIDKLMNGLTIETFANRDAQEVKGYFELLKNIFDAWDILPISESTIKHLHQELLKYVEKDKLHFRISPHYSFQYFPLLSYLLSEKKIATYSIRLFLIGDVSQLPPIEWGRPFYDMIQSKKIPTYFLTKCHRFYEKSGEVNGILENANGMIHQTEWKWNERKNFKILKNSSVIQVIEKVISSNISMNDFSILCPFNKPLYDINQKASKMFLPNAKEITDLTGRIWRIGDRVINLKNRYDFNIMNGDDGEIMDFLDNDGGLKVRFGELLLDFLFSGETSTVDAEEENFDEVDNTPATTSHLVQSYAMTVHKSQGSEWDFVLLYLPYDTKGFITKNLIYTAITRARQCLWIITDSAAILQKVVQLNSEFGQDALCYLIE